MFYLDILRAFQKHKLDFVVVGGTAFNLLGGMRATQDLDIVVRLEDKNILKAVDVLVKKGYKPRQPVDPFDFADSSKRRDWIENKHMKALNFYKDIRSYESVDIIVDYPIGFEKMKKSAVVVKVDRIKIPVVSIDDLIKMKQEAGRPVDKMDVARLKIIKRLNK
jgi:hypothetical protein